MATASRLDDSERLTAASGGRAQSLTEVTADGARLLVTPIGSGLVAKVPLHTARESWRWQWKDILTRVAPFLLASWVWARVTGKGAKAVGIRTDDLLGDIALGVAVGMPLAQIAAIFRRGVASNFRMPTPADNALQCAYYFAVNAPAEELFWRGVAQTAAISMLRRTPGVRRIAGPLGWASVTAAFGAYHRFGGWSWRSILGVTAAGGLFGAMYAAPRRKSLLPAIIAHGFATAGFLNWGDAALFQRHINRLRRSVDVAAREG